MVLSARYTATESAVRFVCFAGTAGKSRNDGTKSWVPELNEKSNTRAEYFFHYAEWQYHCRYNSTAHFVRIAPPPPEAADSYFAG